MSGMWVTTGPICILSSLPLLPPSHHGGVWFLPIISLLLTNTGAGLPNAYPIHMIGEVSWEPKKDMRGPLSIQYSLGSYVYAYCIPQLCFFSGKKVRLILKKQVLHNRYKKYKYKYSELNKKPDTFMYPKNYCKTGIRALSILLQIR
jgi:hypothetical protein